MSIYRQVRHLTAQLDEVGLKTRKKLSVENAPSLLLLEIKHHKTQLSHVVGRARDIMSDLEISRGLDRLSNLET